MQKLGEILHKRPRLEKKEKTFQHQFQEIALDLAGKFKVKGKEQKMLFGFIKRQMNSGKWWKIKEVSEYMELKDINSMRYFMACFSKKNNEHRQNEENGGQYNKGLEQGGLQKP